MEVMWPYFLFIFVILIALSIPRCIKRRRLIKSLDEMEDCMFVGEVKEIFDAPEEYIIEKRRYIGKKLGIPYKKLTPAFRLPTLKSCWILEKDNDASLCLIGDLLEDLYYSKKSPFYKKEVEIETVGEYIYYSAVYDGIVYICD